MATRDVFSEQDLARLRGHLALLHASMSYLRQFAPPVLGAVRFAGGLGTEQRASLDTDGYRPLRRPPQFDDPSQTLA